MNEQFVSMENRTLYYLKTIIVHSKRKKHKLTVNQYAMCDVIDKFIEKHGDMTKQELRAMVDIYCITDPVEEFKKLMQLNMLDMKDGMVILSSKWNDLPKNMSKMFDEFWEEYGKVGNPKKAKIMFTRFLKSGETYENLIKIYWPKYKKYIKQGSTQMHLSSFLNPEEERYKENFVANAHFKSKSDTPEFTIGSGAKSSR